MICSNLGLYVVEGCDGTLGLQSGDKSSNSPGLIMLCLLPCDPAFHLVRGDEINTRWCEPDEWIVRLLPMSQFTNYTLRILHRWVHVVSSLLKQFAGVCTGSPFRYQTFENDFSRNNLGLLLIAGAALPRKKLHPRGRGVSGRSGAQGTWITTFQAQPSICIFGGGSSLASSRIFMHDYIPPNFAFNCSIICNWWLRWKIYLRRLWQAKLCASCTCSNV